jgi:hypothetical protein
MKIKFLLLVLVMLPLGLITSCSDDVYEPDPPVITFPSNGTTTTIGVGESFNFAFTVNAPRGYSSHLLTWTAGSVIQNSSVIPNGETSFTVSGQFTSTIAGPGGISLGVTDREGNSDLATIAFVVTPN